MTLKNKALLFNFIGFTSLFLVFRYVLIDFLGVSSFLQSVISAILAMVLAPKFMVTKIDAHEKLVMKWIFVKGFKTF